MINHAWVNSNYDGFAEYVPTGCVSDHTLTIVSCLERNRPRKKSFEFFNMWSLNEGYQELINSKWCYNGTGTHQFRLKKLLNGFKKPLQQLNMKHFSHLF